MATSPLQLNGANALVCGASGGLGSQITALLSAAGAKVTAIGRDPERLAALPAATTAQLDLRTPNACEEAVKLVATQGPIDLVVNAVGVVAFGMVQDLSTDAMEELFLSNVFVPIMLSKAALLHMNPGGVLVQISGVIAEQNLPGMAAYGASKAALKSFDGAFAREARRAKVRVLDARPPHTETGLATRPVEGEAPRMPEGMAPIAVARIIVEAIADGTADLPSSAFG